MTNDVHIIKSKVCRPSDTCLPKVPKLGYLFYSVKGCL
jgi:hypothetical protein